MRRDPDERAAAGGRPRGPQGGRADLRRSTSRCGPARWSLSRFSLSSDRSSTEGPGWPSNAPVADYAVYLAVRVGRLRAPGAVRCGSPSGFGDALAWLAYRVDRRHREVARDNLRHAFPELIADPAECDRLVRGVYRHFCTMVVEIACLPRRLHVYNWRTYGDARATSTGS